MSWRAGDPQPIPVDSLVTILERHGCSVSASGETSRSVTFPVVDGDSQIGDDGSISVSDAATLEFGIARPRYHPDFYALALDLIQQLDLCMFISSGEVAFVSRQSQIAELPEPLAEVARVVESVGDFGAS